MSRKLFSVLLKLVIALCAAIGVVIQTNIFETPNINAFRMFTVLSNISALLYFLPCAITIGLSKGRNGGDSILPFVKGTVTMCLFLTGIISLAVLTKAVNFTSTMGVSMFLLHIVTPVCSILDYLIFDKKGRLKIWYPIAWTAAPITYTAFILITANTVAMNPHWRFPYPFFDYETFGLCLVCAAILFIAAVYIGVGAALLPLDDKLKSFANSTNS